METLEKAFYHDGYKLGMKALQNGSGQEKMDQALSEMYEIIDSLNDSLSDYAQQQGQHIACKKGCQWCCHQPVFALDYELAFLKKYVEEEFSQAVQNEIKKRAVDKNLKLSLLKGDDQLNAKFPCPLLVDGACMAYKARPVACRIYLSSNLYSCLNFFNKPEDKNSYPALLDFPMRAGRMLNEGFKAALKTEGIIAREFRIEEGII